jgi:hypothetical protein
VARSVGSRLPADVVRLLQPARPSEEELILGFLTVDAVSRPHVTLIGPGEIAVIDESSFVVALDANGSAVMNIAHSPGCTLMVVDPGACGYIKGRGMVSGTRIAPGPAQPFEAAPVRVSIDDVLLDSEAGAAVVTGARYRRDVPIEEEAEQWQRLRQALRDSK